jgi:hypothetical protein
MTRFRSLFASIALAILTVVSTALADWSHTVSYKYSGKTSLKVVEPDGFKVKVTVGGDVKEDTIPTVFQLPDGDAFLPVTVTAKDGSSWSQKIEIKDKQQTELKISYTAATKAAPSGPARKFIGSLVNNTQRCAVKERGDVRLDFLRDGTKAYEFVVPMNRKMQNIEVAQGTYDVRVFIRRGNDFVFVTSSSYNVAKDGWDYTYGCQ